MKPLNNEWFVGVPPSKKDDFEKQIRRESTVLMHLRNMVKRWEAELLRQSSSAHDYNSPSWAYKQAHNNGDYARLRKMKDLLSFLPDGDIS